MRLNLATFVAEPTVSQESSEGRLVDALTSTNLKLSASDADAVESFLLTTTSAKVRNAAALALLDFGHPRLDHVINDVLRRPSVASAAGTLLFCLMETGSRIAAAAVANIVRNGSYEARSELLILTSDGLVSFDDARQVDALSMELASIAAGADGEAAEVAALALADISANRTKAAVERPD